MGRGRSASILGAKTRADIRNGMKTRSSAAVDRVVEGIKKNIEKEEAIVNNFQEYVKTGYITGKNDAWFQNHLHTLKFLKAELEYFNAERKRQNK